MTRFLAPHRAAIAVVFLLTALGLALTGCSGGEGDPAGQDSASGEASTPLGPPAPVVSDSVRAQREYFPSVKEKDLIRPEWLEQGFTMRVVDKTGLAGPEEPLYLMCNYNGMNPADPRWKLTLQEDGTWRIFIPVQNSAERLEFYITRGSAETRSVPSPKYPDKPGDLGWIPRKDFADGQPYLRVVNVVGYLDHPPEG
jgi:hypothetical protein